MKICLPLIALMLAATADFGGRRSLADVIVVSNRTKQPVRFAVTAKNKTVNYSLAAGDLTPVRVDGEVDVSYRSRGKQERYQLRPNSVCFFSSGSASGELKLHEIGFRGRSKTNSAGGRPSRSVPGPFSTDTKTITVKILVDDDQPLLRKIWEPELRKRVAECSRILQRHCFIRLKVVAIDRWDSDDATTGFSKALREFEQEVDPRPAQLAIGFTSQFHVTRGRTHLGGIREPFSRHILIREWRHQASSSGRMELLVHELGHYFGAAHSPEQISAMRPVLADKQANSVDFRVGYDPVNTLIINLVVEELWRRDLKKFRELSPRTKTQLTAVYAEIARALPKDPAAAQFIALMNVGSSRKTTSRASGTAGATRHVLAAIVAAAQRHQRSAAAVTGASQSSQVSGGHLTNLYFRHAAAAAATVDPKISARAYLMALGIALGRTESLQRSPVVSRLLRSVETEQERRHRLSVLGQPTMHGRSDLLAHFVVSAALTATGGQRLAESIGFLKEFSDAQDGSGFSFADLAADYAGIEFANQVLRSPGRLRSLARSFDVDDFVLSDEGLPEEVTSAEFIRRYGASTDERFLSIQNSLRQRIGLLPGYTLLPGDTAPR